MIGQLINFSPGSQARKYIQKEFFTEKWTNFRTWFFETYTQDELQNISEEFYEMCALHNHIVFFVPISSLDTKLDELIVLVNQLSAKITSSDIPSTSKKSVDEGFILSQPCIQRPIEIDGFTQDSPFDQLEKLFDKKFSHLHIQPLNISDDFVHNLESNFADNFDSSDCMVNLLPEQGACQKSNNFVVSPCV